MTNDIVFFMSAPEKILKKIKLLLNLTLSPNAFESSNARDMADALILKYNITEEELKSLEDKKPLYGEDEKLFSTVGLTGWKPQLALAIAKHFDSQIVQEETVPVEGPHDFSYFVYGDKADVYNVKYSFELFVNKVEELIIKNCQNKGPVYISSYCEGVVESIKENIKWDGINIPKAKAPSRTSETTGSNTPGLVKPKEDKEKPAEKSVDINSQSFVKDVVAYFTGMNHGRNISFEDCLELDSDDPFILGEIPSRTDPPIV
jgi:hypothetical protein